MARKFNMAEPTIRFGWETIELAVESLAYMVQPLGIKHIIGVARGGLIPATMLSHKLKLPMHMVIARSYEGTRRTLEKPVEIHMAPDLVKLPNVLIVDDVIDSASTLDALKVRFPAAHHAVIVNKRPLLPAMHFCYVPVGVWVKFPWEVA
jgi:hypoxanthine phosphoribosyltransferase